MELVHIYCQPTIGWQVVYANAIRRAYERHGYSVVVRTKKPCGLTTEALPVVLGPNNWRTVQAECRARGMNYVMVNRAFWGDPSYVTIGWNGFNGHADYVDSDDPSRWNAIKPCDPQPQRSFNPWGYVLLLGQYSLHTFNYDSVAGWLRAAAAEVQGTLGLDVAVRPHPAVEPARRTLAADCRDAALVVSLNSTAIVEALICGSPALAQDKGSVAWGVLPARAADAGAQPSDVRRQNLLSRLAWSQWSVDEIPEGEWVARLHSRPAGNKPMPIFEL